ncbi:MAG TPA: YqgE/AlgH family protein [Geminicoccaceae bacterium]|nr:YqgE/AlgH family protein [Geminicoccaceae bacterium]
MMRVLAAFLALLILLAAPAGGPAGAAQGPVLDLPAPSTAGRLLVAAPELDDPNFRRTVVLMVLHDADGALGLVVNRRYGRAPLGELLRRLGEAAPERGPEVEMFYGGPVEPGTAIVVHSRDYDRPGTTRLGSGLGVTGGPPIFQDIAAGRGPAQSLLVLGYAGWAPGQLEAELRAGAWLVVPAEPDLVLDPEPADKWQRALALGGSEL